MIKVYAKDSHINGVRNQHCCNAEPHGGCCRHMGFWQQGGGWSDRTFIYCDAFDKKVYLDPPIPSDKQVWDKDYYYLIPDDCELLRPNGQMSIFEMII